MTILRTGTIFLLFSDEYIFHIFEGAQKEGAVIGTGVTTFLLVIWLLFILKQIRMRFKQIKSRLFRWTRGQKQ